MQVIQPLTVTGDYSSILQNYNKLKKNALDLQLQCKIHGNVNKDWKDQMNM